jgi:hypothetical protein
MLSCWAKRDGVWQVVLSRVTDVPPQPPAAAGKKGPARPAREGLDDLIGRVLEAHGGEAKLNGLKAFVTKVRQAGANGQVSTVESFVQLPDGYRVEIENQGDAARLICILRPEGMRRWRKGPDGKAEEIHLFGVEVPQEHYLHELPFHGPRAVLRLIAPGTKLSLLGESQVGGRAVLGIRLTPKKGPERRMYFDSETALLAKEEAGTLHTVYRDYKRFDGFPMARKSVQTAAKVAWTQETELLAFRAAEKLDPRLFQQP